MSADYCPAAAASPRSRSQDDDVARPGHFIFWGRPWPRVYRAEADHAATELGVR